MTIDWHAFALVAGAGIGVTAALVGFFTLGIVGLSRPGGGVATRSGAYVCFTLCAAAVAYGLFLIVRR
jgi:hypothetical protein